jgi:hypothetical protein
MKSRNQREGKYVGFYKGFHVRSKKVLRFIPRTYQAAMRMYLRVSCID